MIPTINEKGEITFDVKVVSLEEARSMLGLKVETGTNNTIVVCQSNEMKTIPCSLTCEFMGSGKIVVVCNNEEDAKVVREVLLGKREAVLILRKNRFDKVPEIRIVHKKTLRGGRGEEKD